MRGPPSEQVRALISGYPSRLLPEQLLFMLEAYVDDSVSDFGDKHYFLCAYVHTASAWMAFADDWDRALRAAPSIGHLHMVDAWARNGEFSGWDKGSRNKKLELLGKVIQKYEPFAVQVSLSKRLYDEIIIPVVPYHMRNPYFWCFVGMVYSIPRALTQFGVDTPVDFVFDETTASAETVMWYEYLKEQQPEIARLMGGTPTFKNDKNVMPLQAADMLAWHVRRKSEKRSEHLPAMRYLRKIFAEIEMGEESLRGMAAKLAAVPGVKNLRSRKDWKKLRPLILHSLATKTWPAPQGQRNFLQRTLKWLAALFGRNDKTP